MYRLISFFVIAGFVTIMLYFHQQSSHFGANAYSNHMAEHEGLEVSNLKGAKIPEIDGSIRRDSTGSWMLKIVTNHFSFEPEKLGLDDLGINEGHAHLYINGNKKSRIYSHYYDIGILKPGIYNVKVTLNTNSHKRLMINGKEIAFSYKLNVPKTYPH